MVMWFMLHHVCERPSELLDEVCRADGEICHHCEMKEASDEEGGYGHATQNKYRPGQGTWQRFKWATEWTSLQCLAPCLNIDTSAKCVKSWCKTHPDQKGKISHHLPLGTNGYTRQERIRPSQCSGYITQGPFITKYPMCQLTIRSDFESGFNTTADRFGTGQLCTIQFSGQFSK